MISKITEPGRKYRMAYTGLWCIAGITIVLAVALFILGEPAAAARTGQAGIGALSAIITVYLGGQSYVDRYKGEPEISASEGPVQ